MKPETSMWMQGNFWPPPAPPLQTAFLGFSGGVFAHKFVQVYRCRNGAPVPIGPRFDKRWTVVAMAEGEGFETGDRG